KHSRTKRDTYCMSGEGVRVLLDREMSSGKGTDEGKGLIDEEVIDDKAHRVLSRDRGTGLLPGHKDQELPEPATAGSGFQHSRALVNDQFALGNQVVDDIALACAGFSGQISHVDVFQDDLLINLAVVKTSVCG